MQHLKIAWLFPSLERGNYWHPIWSEFCNVFPKTTIYTGFWDGYSPGFEDKFKVKVVGETKFFATAKPDTGYHRSFILPSMGIVKPLLQLRPDVIFTSAFSLWTVIVLLLKPILRWRVIVVFDGVSPGIDYLNSGSRIYARRAMLPLIDGIITNSHISQKYLVNVLGARSDRVFVRPYLVPDTTALLKHAGKVDLENLQLHHPVFLYVGQLVSRKGVQYLLEACKLLKQESDKPFSLLLVGDGDQRLELEAFVQANGLGNQIKFVGQVKYAQLGAFFRTSDVFVFPTLEDIWGMVILEAMAFGKPVLCSKWAASTEMIREGENGYIFDPYNTEKLLEIMFKFMVFPGLARSMGEESKNIISPFTPLTASIFFTEVIDLIK